MFYYPGFVQCLDKPWAEMCNAFGVEFLNQRKLRNGPKRQRASPFEMPFAISTNTPQAFHTKAEVARSAPSENGRARKNPEGIQQKME